MRPAASRSAGRAGFTLLEVVIAMGLLGLIAGNVYMLLGESAKTYGTRTSNAEVDSHLRRTLDRIELAVVGASRSSLYLPAEAPWSTSELNYQTNLGVQDGEVVWSDPQRIAQTKDNGLQVCWFENFGAPEVRRVAWSNWVRDLLAGEDTNGADDNGNGLVDEAGLSFDLEGNSIRIHLTVEREGPDGKVLERTLESLVTCRN